MATAAVDAPSEADGGSSSSSSVSSSVGSAPPLAVEAVATEWMLEFACSCLCRHFAEQSGAEFWRWRDVAQGEGQRRRLRVLAQPLRGQRVRRGMRGSESGGQHSHTVAIQQCWKCFRGL